MKVLATVGGSEKMAGTNVVVVVGEGVGGDVAMALDRLDENHAVSVQQEGEHQIQQQSPRQTN